MAMGTVDHYMPMFGRDFLASTAGWTAAERGHYFVLLIVQWEQGAIPDGLDRLELVSPGVTAAWAILEPKFPVGDDGLRRNRRLEAHREKAQELKDARSEAGKRGNDARWARKRIASGSQTVSQTDRKAIADGVATDSRGESCAANGSDSAAAKARPNCHSSEDGQGGSQTDRKRIANGIAKTSPPSPSPNRKERQYARADGETPRSGAGSSKPEPEPAEDGDPAATVKPTRPAWNPGWVQDEWSRVVEIWNATERAVPWTLVTPPNGFADLAASPGWVAQAIAAMAMLPECRRFDRPVPWTQFVRDLDRILAGEFRDPRDAPRQLAAAGGRQQKRGNL
jgi:uncharacterized protein YdaU (DUF1376 family)